MSRSPFPDRSDKPFEEGPSRGTRLESAGEIKRAIKRRRTPPPREENDSEGQTSAFRPLRRPPSALLCILDDGLEDGEWLRLRGDQYVIGRTDGKILIPHDSMISGRHAELSRRLENGRQRWFLTDLQSTNGTYVRIGDALLKHNQELLVGSRRYRFESLLPVAAGPDDQTELVSEGPGTSGWQSVSAKDLAPNLVELTTKGEGQRLVLSGEENWMGRDKARCHIVITDDPFVSPRHVRIYRDPKGRWHAENGKTLNGTWLRVDSMALDSACQFQLGEQRFILKVL
jgi:pSer/pThr/pTyr-binding forkhead associated (FHA) protein